MGVRGIWMRVGCCGPFQGLACMYVLRVMLAVVTMQLSARGRRRNTGVPDGVQAQLGASVQGNMSYMNWGGAGLSNVRLPAPCLRDLACYVWPRTTRSRAYASAGYSISI